MTNQHDIGYKPCRKCGARHTPNAEINPEGFQYGET